MRIWIKRIVWVLFFVGVIALMVRSCNVHNARSMDKPKIVIHVKGEDAFLTEDELYDRLKRKGLIFEGQTHKTLKASVIERFISTMSEVKDVRVFTRIGSAWTIEVTVRKPIARIYNQFHETFYLDEDGIVVKTSGLHTARVVVVTGFIPDRIRSISVKEIINNDSLKSIRKLDDVYRISNYVCNDPELQALIGQIHLKKNGDFVLIPLVGDQLIVFGSAFTDQEVRDKFEKLKIFYTKGLPYEGWEKYSEISLKYRGQIVGKIKDGYKDGNEENEE
jgi:cell division protein FtsQ